MPGTLQNLPPGATADQQVAVLNQIIDTINTNQRLDIINDNATDRVLLGTYPPAGGPNSYTGLRVSKPGKDVKTSTGLDLIFDSNNDVFRIVASGNTANKGVTITQQAAGSFNSGFSRVTIPHNLGYAPAILGFINYNSTSYVSMPYVSIGGGGTDAVWITLQLSVDTTNVYLETYVTKSGGGSGTYTIADNLYPVKYYLLQETAN